VFNKLFTTKNKKEIISGVDKTLKMTYIMLDAQETPGHGISNYYQMLIEMLDKYFPEVKYELISNKKSLSRTDFSKYAFNIISRKYQPNNCIIEAAETHASSIFFPRNWKVHIRFHCPTAVVEKYIGASINQDILSGTIRCISKAHYCSMPNLSLYHELNNEINMKNVSVYANPISNQNIPFFDIDQKEYDVIFFSRVDKLKGAEYINPILERLDKNFKVLILGLHAKKFKISQKIKCHVILKEHLISNKKFRYLGKAKTMIFLSKFENQPMAVLESISAGTMVLSWNIEALTDFSKKTVKTFKIGDIDKISNCIKYICNNINQYPKQDIFIKDIENKQHSFISGFKEMLYKMGYQ